MFVLVFFFKQKTAYEMRISDWSSEVCSSDLQRARVGEFVLINGLNFIGSRNKYAKKSENRYFLDGNNDLYRDGVSDFVVAVNGDTNGAVVRRLENVYPPIRSEAHTYELQSLMSIWYAVYSWKTTTNQTRQR